MIIKYQTEQEFLGLELMEWVYQVSDKRKESVTSGDPITVDKQYVCY